MAAQPAGTGEGEEVEFTPIHTFSSFTAPFKKI